MSRVAFVVEPNAERAALYRLALAGEGLAAQCFDDGSLALQALRRGTKPALLITELSLPGIDGFTLLAAARTLDGPGAPVLVVSAFREMRETATSLRETLGIGAVLTTASGPDIIRRVIRRLLTNEVVEEASEITPTLDVEARRLASIDEKGLVNEHANDDELEALVRRVARTFGVPISLVSLVLEKKQWFKARVGLAANETPRDVSFCRHVVTAGEPLVVPDATVHPTFANNPLVRERIVRGYAGAPLVGSDGEVWGSLCIISPDEPLLLNASELKSLALLARQVVAELERRRPGQPSGAGPDRDRD